MAERLALEDVESIRTKDVVEILRHEISNWIRWGHKKDWKPAGFRCPLGILYKSTDYWMESHKPLRCDEVEAAQLEKVIVGLPQRHRMAFLLYHLDRAAENGMIKCASDRNRKAAALGVHIRQYHNIVAQAHCMVLREWKKMKIKS